MINALFFFGWMDDTLFLYFLKLNLPDFIHTIINKVECFACDWYILSFIPFAQNLFTSIGKSCYNTCLKGEDA